MNDFKRVFARASLDSNNRRFVGLLTEVLSKFPRDANPLTSVKELRLKKRGGMKGLVGLTTYCCVEIDNDPKSSKKGAIQRITFYSDLLDEISDKAAMGVIAHELAHAWLNEHVHPEDSERREKQADELARSWGYGEYLDALAAETEPIGGYSPTSQGGGVASLIGTQGFFGLVGEDSALRGPEQGGGGR